MHHLFIAKILNAAWAVPERRYLKINSTEAPVIRPLRVYAHRLVAECLVLCLRNNLLKKILCDRSLEGGVGVYFHFRHPKTSKPVTAPKEDNVRRTGTKNARRCGHMALWGCFVICINLVPFHDLWSDGGETENRPPCPQSRTIQSGQSNTSYF